MTTACAGRIGIYWIHEGRILGKACAPEAAEPGLPGVLDSPFTHVDAWPGVRIDSRMPLPADFDALPRGRVLYVPAQGRWLVYGDGPLLGAGSAKPLRPEVVALRQANSGLLRFRAGGGVVAA